MYMKNIFDPRNDQVPYDQFLAVFCGVNLTHEHVTDLANSMCKVLSGITNAMESHIEDAGMSTNPEDPNYS